MLCGLMGPAAGGQTAGNGPDGGGQTAGNGPGAIPPCSRGRKYLIETGMHHS